MPGMHGHYTAVTALQKSDLLISLGARFDDRVTGKISAFAPDAKVIHVDIDPAELGKVRIPDVGIAGDVRQVIEEMLLAMDSQADRPVVQDLARGGSRSTSGGSASRCTTRMSKAGRSSRRTWSSSSVMRHRRTPSSSPAWASTKCGLAVLEVRAPLYVGELRRCRHHGFRRARRIGAKVGRPDRTVWAIDGDGCFQ